LILLSEVGVATVGVSVAGKVEVKKQKYVLIFFVIYECRAAVSLVT